jgi:hypothetical protein
MPSYSDEDLLDAIRRVADHVDADNGPTLQQFREHSSIADTTIMRRFGSWNDAVAKAGFEPNAPETAIPKADLLDELQRLREELGRIPTGDQMNDHGRYSRSTYQQWFGSWSDALTEAFNDTSEAGAHVSNDELIAELHRVADEHGTPPRFEDMRHHGAHRARTYAKRFGSWDDALQAAGIDAPTREIPTADLIADLYRLRDQLGERPTSTDVAREGEYGLATYQRRFGSWGAAAAAAFEDADSEEAAETTTK